MTEQRELSGEDIKWIGGQMEKIQRHLQAVVEWELAWPDPAGAEAVPRLEDFVERKAQLLHELEELMGADPLNHQSWKQLHSRAPEPVRGEWEHRLAGIQELSHRFLTLHTLHCQQLSEQTALTGQALAEARITQEQWRLSPWGRVAGQRVDLKG